MRHTINLLVENKLGCLARIAGLFSSRGYTIDTITAGDAEKPGLSRITIVTHGEDKVIEQITKHLDKVVDVIEVHDLTGKKFLQRELALIKVQASAKSRLEIMQIVDVFRGKVVDISPNTLTIEVTGSEDKVNAIISMLRPFEIKEVERTGQVAIPRDFQGET